MEQEIKTVIQQALDLTTSSRELYLTMANLVERPETKEMFQYLARNEESHTRFFQSILDEVVCPLEVPLEDTHVSEFLKCPPITRKMSPKEALVLAVKREETLHKFYKYLEDMQPPGEIKNLLKEMTLIKLEHKEKLEYIYGDVAFPEARKEIADLIREAMDHHEMARDLYHRLAQRVSHADTQEMFEYLAREAEENKARLQQCLTPEGCPVVPPAHELHLAEHLQVPEVSEGMAPKEALALAIKRSEGLCRFYQSLLELQPQGEIRRRLEYLA